MQKRPATPSVPRISPLMWRWFSWYAARFLRKHFHAVRLLRGGEPPAVPLDQPLIVYCNHPSWWDPMIGIFLASRFWPERNHYWPIDAAMLQKYPVFAKLGFFGIEKDSPRGGATFLRTATAALQEERACLWVTAQGEFADVRQRPVRIKPGLAHLARRLERGTILPLAGEYPFWTERTPEALLRFGRPLDAVARPSHDELERTLADAMDALAAAAIAREPTGFTRLLGGAAGTGAVYDAWRRARAFATRQRFDAAHADETGADVTPASRPERA